MNIRYFFINIWLENSIKFFCELKLSLFNNILVMAFSNCEQEVCEESQYERYEHYSSLIFFNYPNINNTNFDIINYIYPDNKDIQNEIDINFEDYLIIDNNIFGFIYKGIKIISYSDEINLLINENNIDDIPLIEAGEKVKLKFKSNSFYKEGSYIVEFTYVITEPDYGTNNDYIIYIDETKGNIADEQQYFKKHEYIGRYTDLNVTLTKNLSDNCNDICSLCYNENKENCVTCKYNFYFNKETDIKTCYNIETEKFEQMTSTIPDQKKTQTLETTFLNKVTQSMTYQIIIPEEKNISVSYTIDDILSGYSKLSSNQIKIIYDKLKTHIASNYREIFSTENVIFQISPLHEQKEIDNPNISSIDLDECEKILKSNSNLTDEEDLIVYKIDIKNENSSITFVQYEIYNPRSLKIMSLEECKDTKIIVKVPFNLDERSQSIYDSLSKSGYNLFELSDDFYNDICSTYTTENETDLTLADRKNIIFDTNGNITICQEGCAFQNYNITTKKSECDCEVQTRETIN